MTKNFTKGNILTNLVQFSLPFLLSYFLQTLYGLADLFIVGQFNGSATITAVSIGSQVMHMLTVILVGLAMGSTVMISRAIGAKKEQEASIAIGNTITIFLIISIISCIVLVFVTDFVVNIMSTPMEAVEQTRLYLVICFIGIPMIAIYNVISSIFRGLGDSKSPMYFVAISCIVNIILDYVFIGIFSMQAIGAALGTIIAQTVSVIFALIYVKQKDRMIKIHRNDLKLNKVMIGQIMKIGVPVALQDGFIQVSFIVITIIANMRGVDVAAAVGIVEKVISMLFLVPSSMLSAVSAIAAQNMGAGLHARASKTLKYGIIITVGFGLVAAIIIQFVASPLIALFTSETAVIVFGTQYLKAYVFDCMFAGVHFCFSGYFCAYGKSLVSFIHNVISILAIRIPGAYIASILYPDTLFPMGLASPAGSLLSAMICVGVFIWMRNKKTV